MTGSTGFIGSHLVPHLKEHEVHLLDRYVTGRPPAGDSFIHMADLTDFTEVRNLIARIKPEVVVHLAAISPVSYSYRHPVEVMNANTLATLNLAEAALVVPGFQHMVVAGTTEEYGVTPDRPATEQSRCLPNSPYAVSKHAATAYLLYLHMAKAFPVTIMRSTNTYGRINDAHFFIEKTVRQMMRGGDVSLGDPMPVRDFMYVDDHVDAYLKVLAQKEAAVGEVFNFSTGNYSTVRECAQRIAKVLDFPGSITWNSIAERPLDIQDHRIDSTKARRILGWQARVSFEEGIAKTARLLRRVVA